MLLRTILWFLYATCLLPAHVVARVLISDHGVGMHSRPMSSYIAGFDIEFGEQVLRPILVDSWD